MKNQQNTRRNAKTLDRVEKHKEWHIEWKNTSSSRFLSLLVLLVILKAEHLNQHDVCVVQFLMKSYFH